MSKCDGMCLAEIRLLKKAYQTCVQSPEITGRVGFPATSMVLLFHSVVCFALLRDTRHMQMWKSLGQGCNSVLSGAWGSFFFSPEHQRTLRSRHAMIYSGLSLKVVVTMHSDDDGRL